MGSGEKVLVQTCLTFADILKLIYSPESRATSMFSVPCLTGQVETEDTALSAAFFGKEHSQGR